MVGWSATRSNWDAWPSKSATGDGPSRWRLPQSEGMAARTGRLRRPPAGLVVPQGDEAPPLGAGDRQVPEVNEPGGSLARPDPQVRVGSRAGGPIAQPQGAAGPGEAEGPV